MNFGRTDSSPPFLPFERGDKSQPPNHPPLQPSQSEAAGWSEPRGDVINHRHPSIHSSSQPASQPSIPPGGADGEGGGAAARAP